MSAAPAPPTDAPTTLRAISWVLAAFPVIACAQLIQQIPGKAAAAFSLAYCAGALYLVARGVSARRTLGVVLLAGIATAAVAVYTLTGIAAMIFTGEFVQLRECLRYAQSPAASEACSAEFNDALTTRLGVSLEP